MKSNDMFKYALIAGAAYLAWKSGMLDKFNLPFLPPSGALPAPATTSPTPAPTGGGTPTGAAPPATMPAPTNGPTGGGGATSTPTPTQNVSYTSAQIDDMTKAAAAGDMAAAAVLTGLGVRYNGHQWNWFREQAGNPPAPGTAGLDDIMTATQYLAYRAGLGLSGVISLGGMRLGGVRC